MHNIFKRRRGQAPSPLYLGVCQADMIDKELLHKTVGDAIDGIDLFIVDISVSPDNTITVTLDSPTSVDIDECAKVTRAIEAAFDRDAEDYELEVGSAGITSPMQIRAQFVKNEGNDVEILTRDGRKLHGVLIGVEAGDMHDRDVAFTVEVPVRVKEPGMKKAEMRNESLRLTSGECKYVRYDLKF